MDLECTGLKGLMNVIPAFRHKCNSKNLAMFGNLSQQVTKKKIGISRTSYLKMLFFKIK